MPTSRSLESLTAEDFREVKGGQFRLAIELAEPGATASLEVELAEVTEVAGLPSTFRAPFSVLFHGPIEPVLPQAIYQLEHDQFGVVGLFLVAIGPELSAGQPVMRYEAVFG